MSWILRDEARNGMAGLMVIQTIAPLIYTPVVGEACQKWSEIYRQPEGMLV